jgi:hypothetical protein
LEMKEAEIYEFQLNNSNRSLIGYLQMYMPEIYEESILHFFTYYRTTFHEKLIKQTPRREGPVTEIFNERYVQTLYLLSAEYAYMCYCCRVSSYDRG